MAHLSTHILDLSTGRPASSVKVDFYRDGVLLRSVLTNVDGRVAGESVETGVHELVFHAGDYFRGRGLVLDDPPFLDEIVIRFGVSDPGGRYHVPLLLSPYGYSTYRGS